MEVRFFLEAPIYEYHMHEFDDPEFRKAFWEWFDSLPVEEKDKFKYYPADLAELNFYNRIYKHLER